MKKFICLLLPLLFSFTSCTAVKDNQDPISFSATSFTLSADGAAQSLIVTARGGQWHIAPSEDWLHVNPDNGAGSATVSISADPNPTTSERSAILEVVMPGAFSGYIGLSVKQEAGTGELPDDGDDDDKEKATATVVTGGASAIGRTQATLNGSFSGASGTISDRGFYYGLSMEDISMQRGLNSTEEKEGSFSVTLQNLLPGRVYYYKAYVTEFNGTRYEDRLGEVLSFTTKDKEQPAPGNGLQYLGCYEIPALSLTSTESCNDSDTEADCNTKWYNYTTTNPNQMIVTHTFPYQGHTYRNYTILVDKEKKAALWNAFVMHGEVYGEDNNVGRSGNWHRDPALDNLEDEWQSCFSSSGYSRGHQVASNYRQVCVEANKQTFYYTNQALQYQTQFNDGVWNSLEQAVKSHQPSGTDSLYVVVGLLYEDSKTLQGVPVPSHFYKCLMKCSFDEGGIMTNAKGCAYIFTNEAHPGMSYSAGQTTIKAIEERSGWNFFANVPQNLQEAAENTATPIW